MSPRVREDGEKQPVVSLEEDADRSAPTARRPGTTKKRGRGGCLAAALVALLLLGGAAGFVYVRWDDIVLAFVLSEARAHGVTLAVGSLTLERDGLVVKSVTLSRAKLTATSLPGVTIEADEIVVAVDADRNPVTATTRHAKATFDAAPGVVVTVGKAETALAAFAPRAMSLTKVEVEAPDAHALFALSEVAAKGPLAAIDTHAAAISLHLGRVSDALAAPLVVAVEGFEREGDATVLTGVSTRVPVLDRDEKLDRVEILATKDPVEVKIPKLPEVTVRVGDRGRKIDVELSRVPAELLSRELGWSRPPDFALSARATIALPEGKGAVVTGSYEAVLEHYVPPHPRELDGIVFGDATKATGDFRLLGERLSLTSLKVVAGALHLEGEGTATAADAGRVELTLSGSIACSELAASAIGAHLGLQAGFFAGQLARGRLTGTVGVRLGVVLTGKDAAHPEVHPSASLHCGLSL